MKKCPYCAEEIQDEAIKCKHCGEFIESQEKEQIVEKKLSFEERMSSPSPSQNQNTPNQEYSIPHDVLEKATHWKVHKIKDPIQYGGWSKRMGFWALIPLVGLIIGIRGLSSDSVVKNAQAKSLIFVSLLFLFMGIANFIIKVIL